MRLITLLTLLVMACLQALPAHALDWKEAPLACLPDRAEKWETSDEMQPCHCPPQSYCPDKLEIQPEDIIFYFSTSKGHSGEITSNDLATPLDMDKIFAYTTNQIKKLIAPAIKKKYGLDILRGRIWRTTITMEVNNDDLEDWKNNTLKLPVPLAIRCCDNVCPAGMTPTIEEVEILRPRDSGEGVTLGPDGAAILQEDVAGLLEAIWDKIDDWRAKAKEHWDKDTVKDGKKGDQYNDKANALEEAYWKIKCIDEYLEEMQEDGIYCEMVDEMLEHLNELVDALDTLPGTIADDHKESLQALESLHADLEEEKRICNAEDEYITVEQFTCSAEQKFEVPREGCLSKGTKITMADGSLKNIETLKLGDKVMGNHGEAEVIAHSVFTQKTDMMYSINGGKAFFTVEHPVLTPKGWKSMDPKITSTKSDAKIVGQLRVGDVILMAGGKELKVESIEEKKIEGGVSAYNLSVTGDGSFIANGFIMKSFKQMQMHY